MPLPEFEPVSITLAEHDGATVVAFTGTHLTDDENVELLGHELFTLSDDFGCERMVLNMAGVAFLTSSVLGKIISLHRKQHRNNGRLVLCNISDGVADILETSRLINYFNTADDVSAAAAAAACE